MNKTSKKRSAGFSVLELLVAVTVIGISLLGLAQLMAVAMQQNSFARYNTAGMEVARGKLEELKADYNRYLETGVPATSLSDGEHGPETVALPSQTESYATRSLTVKWWVQSASATRKNVRITVWPTGERTDEDFLSKQAKAITVNTAFTP